MKKSPTIKTWVVANTRRDEFIVELNEELRLVEQINAEIVDIKYFPVSDAMDGSIYWTALIIFKDNRKN